MAQPAVPVSDHGTDLQDVSVFWHKPTSDSSSSGNSWIGQFKLPSLDKFAIKLRERCDPRELLKPPGVVHDDPPSDPGAVRMRLRLRPPTASRVTRQQFAWSMKSMTKKGRKVPGLHLEFSFIRGNNASNPDFFLGFDGRKPFAHIYPHVDLSANSFKELYDTCVLIFKKEKNYIIVHLQIYNAVHSDLECLEAFFLRLMFQAALCRWTVAQQKEFVRESLIAKIHFKYIQRELCIIPPTLQKKL